MSVPTTTTTPSYAAAKSSLLILIHGLDSSSSTWNNVLPKLKADTVVAMDCRGCGLNRDDLHADSFSIDGLVQDVEDCRTAAAGGSENGQLVLLGHSMGARIAFAYAAKYPEKLSCLIMEDMDIGRRPIAEAPFTIARRDRPFQRSFSSAQEATEALLQIGYPPERVTRWLNEGRIVQQQDGSWWSMINPDFRRLCYERVVDNDSGIDQCRVLETQASSNKFPIHVFVGGPDQTICRNESLEYMKQSLQDRVTIHNDFPTDATHSIHSSHLDIFCDKVNAILKPILN